MIVLVGFPWVFWKGTFERELLVNVHVVDVVRHGSVIVLFDQEIEVATFFFAADGCVGSDCGFFVFGTFVLGQDGGGGV